MTNDQLALRIRAGEDTAGNMLKLWQQNQRIICKTVNYYSAYGEKEDLLQEGFLGLCEAVRHWKPDGGASFMTYAVYWIKQGIGRYIKSNGTIRIPEFAQTRVKEYQRMEKQWLLEFGRKPTQMEACRYLDISPAILRQIEKDIQMEQIQSLDVSIGEDEGGTMYDLVPGSSDLEESIVDRVQQEQLRAVVWPLVDELPGQQPAIIRKRYLEGKTLQTTGDDLGVTPERARTIEANALRELRKPSRSRRLRPFLEDERIYSGALRGNGVGNFNRTWTSSTERLAMLEEEEREYRMLIVPK